MAAAPWLDLVAHQLERADYLRTYRCWYARAMERSSELEVAIGKQGFAELKRYFGAVLAVFRTGQWQLLRVVMQRTERADPTLADDVNPPATFAAGTEESV